jgi:hypothetical protein
MFLGGSLFCNRAVELATEFLFVAAIAAAGGRVENHKLKRIAFHIGDISCGYNEGASARFRPAVTGQVLA